MEQPSPARLFAALVGAALVAFGMVGFFFDASFADPGDLGDALGLLAVNGWANVFHIVAGAIGLLLAGFAPRRYALYLSAFYVAVAVSGVI